MDVQLWLQALVQMTLLGICAEHEAEQKELKRFCIDCQIHTCDECVNGDNHIGHHVLKIYRYSAVESYPAVVKSEIQEHMDCSQIQDYTSHRRSVLILKPILRRPQQQNGEHACATCMRRVRDPINQYCSLYCKLQAYLRKENNSDPPFLEHQGPTLDAPVLDIGGPTSNVTISEMGGRSQGRKRKRKVIPRRAPLF